MMVLLGGGIDSSYIAFYLSHQKRKHVIGIHFDYGQASSSYEKKAIRDFSSATGIDTMFEKISFPMILDEYEYKFRNLLLLLASSPFSIERGCSRIFIGIHRDSPYYDASSLFLNDAQLLLDRYFGGSLQVSAPLIDLTKPEIWKLVKSFHGMFPLKYTYSCQNGIEFGCGYCPSCLDRKALADEH